MNHPEAHELGRFEARDHPEHARLFTPLQLRLKADEAVVIGRQIVLPELHDGVRPPARARDRSGRLASSARTEACPTPRCAMTSIGRHPSKNCVLSKSCTAAFSAETIAVVKRAGIRPGSTDSSGSRRRRRLHRPGRRGGAWSAPRRLRFQREARNTFALSIVSASTMG